jgi:hypothetical protein
MMTLLVAVAVSFFLIGTSYLWGYHSGLREGRQDGFIDGERHGRLTGYRQAWLKQNPHLLDPETEDWYDEC